MVPVLSFVFRRSMAWSCRGRSNEELVQNLKDKGLFRSARVEKAMLQVDRIDFCPRDPYADSPQMIGSNATISAPHMHANALEELEEHLTEGSRVLDVGCGSGYLTVAMALMVGPSGSVVGIEHIPDLVLLATHNIARHHSSLLESGRIRIVEGDGRRGFPEGGPYNAIHVGAAPTEMPEEVRKVIGGRDWPVELVNQLAEGGRMVIPVGRKHQQVFYEVDKREGRINTRRLYGVSYVPLTTKEEQLKRFLSG